MVKRKANKRGRLIAAVLTLVAVIAAVLVFLYRNELFGRDEFAGANAPLSSEPYTYEYGASQQFALIGSKLAVSSSTGLQILDQNGYTIVRQVFSMKNPAVCSNDKLCAFYDVGGTALRVYSGGEVIKLDTPESIISVSVSSAGYITVASEKSGYKGFVTVYNDKGEPVYKFDSGSGYVLDAALSPNGSALAVLALESSGSVIHLFEINSEDETGSISIPGDVAFDLAFTSNDSFCVVSSSIMRFYKTDAGELGSFDFDGMKLTDYRISESFCVVSLSRYVSGSTVTLTAIDSGGSVLGSAELGYSPLELYSAKDKLMVFGSGTISVYSKDLSRVSETAVPAGYNSAVYLPDGSCLLLSSYHGDKISVK